MATCYETLGIDPRATPDEVDRAYRFLAQKFHPDANPGNVEFARKRFQVVQEAYDILSDPKQRRKYDVKLGAGMGTDWELITMNTDNGGVRFNSDGSLNVAGRRIEAEEGVQKTSIGPATMEKDAGPSGEFRIWHNGKMHRFRYANKGWYAKREKPAGTKQERPAEKASNALTTPAPPVYRAPPEMIDAAPSRNRRRPLRTMLIAGGLLLIGLAGGFYASHSRSASLALSPDEQIKQKEDELQKRVQLADLNKKLQVQATIDERQRQEAALTKDRLLEAKRKGEGALSSVENLLAEIDQWDKQVPPLLTNEDGRKLATSESNVRVFKSLCAKRRVTKDEALALRTEIESLLTPITQNLASSSLGHGTGEDFNQRLQAKKDDADRLASEVHEARESIRNLVVVAAGVSPSPKTLGQALADIALGDTQREAELIARTEKDTREAASAEIAKARQTLLNSEAEKERLALESQASAVQDKIQHDKDLAEAKKPAVQNAIRFFTTPGYYQPDAQALYSKTVEPHPISYAKLLAQGALEPTNQGLEKLLFIATKYPSDSRPKWNMSMSTANLTPEQSKQLADTQGYLRRLGGALVELKLLDP